MIFNTQLPPAVLVTWIQLRCLAWGGWVTPTLSISELASLIGIHPARLHRHLYQLKDISALSWHSTGQGTMTISFTGEPPDQPGHQPGPTNLRNTRMHNSKNTELPAPSSYFPPRILGYLSFQEDEEGFLNGEEDSEIMEEVSWKGDIEFSGDRVFLDLRK
jgi:hypothetical protein